MISLAIYKQTSKRALVVLYLIMDILMIIINISMFVAACVYSNNLNRDEKNCMWFSVSFPILGLIDQWPIWKLGGSYPVLTTMLWIRFCYMLVYWPLFVFYIWKRCEKFRDVLEMVVLIVIVVALWLFVFQCVFAVTLRNDYEDCVYRKYEVTREKCWKLRGKEWKREYGCVNGWDISTAFWFSWLGGFGGIKLAVEYRDYRDICHNQYGYPLTTMHVGLFWLAIWSIFYMILLIIGLIKLPGTCQRYVTKATNASGTASTHTTPHVNGRYYPRTTASLTVPELPTYQEDWMVPSTHPPSYRSTPSSPPPSERGWSIGRVASV